MREENAEPKNGSFIGMNDVCVLIHEFKTGNHATISQCDMMCFRLSAKYKTSDSFSLLGMQVELSIRKDDIPEWILKHYVCFNGRSSWDQLGQVHLVSEGETKRI